MIAIVGVVIFLLAFGRGPMGILYDKYKLKNILSGVIQAERTSGGAGGNRQSEMKKSFATRLQFEQITAVTPDDLQIENEGGTLALSLDYQHCAPLWSGWTVCAQQHVRQAN